MSFLLCEAVGMSFLLCYASVFGNAASGLAFLSSDS